MHEPVLVGDIGGTNVRLAEAIRKNDGALLLDDVRVLAGSDHADFEAALEYYLHQRNHRLCKQALFAFAGPVIDNTIEMTNRNWFINGQRLAGKFGFEAVKLVNDYAAMARSIPELPEDVFETLHTGVRPKGRAPILVAGPGTGLGVATLLPDGHSGWRVITGEGGHAAFAPRTQLEWTLAERLRDRFEYVSKELVLSGSGMDAVHRAICEIYGVPWVRTPPAQLLEEAKREPGIARDICQIRARATLDALGDAAVTNGTTGGVVITGGVAVRLADWLREPESLARFFNRGPKQSYMLPIPIRLLHSGQAALIGAAALHYDEELAA
ncbi:MAG: glucokinase [Henriciella sp.]|nr:glucokinase [Henriciella sp.]